MIMVSDTQETIKVSLCEIAANLVRNVDCLEFVVSLIISSLLTWYANCETTFCDFCLRDTIYSIIPSLLGFSIAAYTILLSLENKVYYRLSLRCPKDKKRPIKVLYATFVLGMIIEGIALLLGVFSNNTMVVINTFVLIFSIIWTVNMVIHLFCVSTFK